MIHFIKFIIIFVIFSNFSYSQNEKKFFVDDKQDYAFLLDSDIKQSNRNQPNAEIDVYIKTAEGKFNYTILVSKIINHEFENGNLIDGKYETYFKETCNCEVSEIDLVFYNNIKPLRHFISAKKGDNSFKGINASFVSGKYLYNILFLTFEKEFDELKANFSEIMNTLIINGKTTVENYLEYKKSE